MPPPNLENLVYNLNIENKQTLLPVPQFISNKISFLWKISVNQNLKCVKTRPAWISYIIWRERKENHFHYSLIIIKNWKMFMGILTTKT